MTRRRSPARLVTSAAGTILVAVLALCGYAVVAGNGGFAGTGGGASPGSGGSPQSPQSSQSSQSSRAGSPVPGASGPSTAARDADVPSAEEARALLAALPIKGSAPATGYDRVGRFGEAWLDVDGNGCDTSAAVQIDHVLSGVVAVSSL